MESSQQHPHPAVSPARNGLPWWAWLLISIPFGLCCLGVGSAVAIPAFIRYVKRSKTIEADANLRSMASGASQICTSTGHLPGAAGPAPAVIPGPNKIGADTSAYPAFASIGFNPGAPVHYQYSIVVVAQGVELRADGDLDGDGIISHRVVRCSAACTCAPMTVENELE